MTKDWNKQEIEQLKALWELGMTTAKIAAEMGRTKNSICAKARRVNLPIRQESRPRTNIAKEQPKIIGHAWRGEYKKERLDGTLPFQTRKEIAKTTYGHGVTPFERKSCECLWPIGDPRKEGFHFCGAKVHAKNYCEAHYMIGYRRPQERKAS